MQERHELSAGPVNGNLVDQPRAGFLRLGELAGDVGGRKRVKGGVEQLRFFFLIRLFVVISKVYSNLSFG